MPATKASNEAARFLRRAFEDSGYVRIANLKKRAAQGSRSYKKGYEVRLVCETEKEAVQVARALESVGLRPGKRFTKHSRIVVPVYGQGAVDWFTAPRK